MFKVRATVTVLASASLWSASVFGFQVNTYTSSHQNVADVAVDDSGNFVVVWESDGQDGDGDGVFGRRFDSTGAPLSPEFQVNAHTTGDQTWASVSMAPAGGFVVTWTEGGSIPPDTSLTGIRAQRFDASGVPAGTAFTVNTFTTGQQAWPGVAHDGAGNFTITWTSDGQDGDSTGVFAQRYDSAGSAMGSEFQVNTYTPGQQSANESPAIAAAPGGTVTIVWHSQAQDDGDIGAVGGGVYAQQYDASGSPVGTEFQVNVATAGGQGKFGIDVAADSLGNLVVAWTDNNEGPPFLVPGGNVAARRFTSLGAPVGGEFTVNTRLSGGQWNPNVAVDGAGNFLISYFGNDGDDDGVLAQNFGSDGLPLGTEFRINPAFKGFQGVGGIDASPGGHFVVGWGGGDGSGNGVFVRRFETAQPTCAAAPLSSCRAAGKKLLLMKSGAPGKLIWKWGRGDAYDEDDLGNPEAGLTDWVFCVYRDDGASTLVYEAGVDAGGSCPDKPCWRSGKMGAPYSFRNKLGMGSDGITKLRLRDGDVNRGNLQLKGRGAELTLPTLPLGPFTSVTAQLVNGNGDCWESTHAEARVDSSGVFKAK